MSTHHLVLVLILSVFRCAPVALAQGTPASFTLIDANNQRPVGPLGSTLNYITLRSSSHLFNIEYKPPSIPVDSNTKTDTVQQLFDSILSNTTISTNSTNTTVSTNTTNSTISTNSTNTTIFTNITVSTNTTNTTIPTYQSTKFTFDTYNRIHCDTTSPFLLYGFTNGTTYGRELFLGNRSLTATPYTGPNCTGTKGPTSYNPFTVSGCMVDFVSKRLATRKRIFEIPPGAVLSSHPCNETVETYQLNFKARVMCGFPVKQVKIAMYNNTADGSIYVHQNTSYAYPYYLFGYRTDYLPGANVRPGNYTLTATINNIPHPPVNFSIEDKCFNYTAIHS